MLYKRVMYSMYFVLICISVKDRCICCEKGLLGQKETQFTDPVKNDWIYSSICPLSPGTTWLLRLPSANDGWHPQWHNWTAGEGVWGAARHLSGQSSTLQWGSGICRVGLWTRRSHAQHLTFDIPLTVTQTQPNKHQTRLFVSFLIKAGWWLKCKHVNNS